LKTCKEREVEVQLVENNLQKELAKDELQERGRMLSLINGQLRFYDLERLRWEKELETKERELLELRETHEEEMEINKKVYEDKFLKNQLKFISTEQNLNE
jgi:hypothetical protein